MSWRNLNQRRLYYGKVKRSDAFGPSVERSQAKPSTQRTYLREAKNLPKYFDKSPVALGENELKAYLPYLIKERHLSEGTFGIYVAGLKFLYRKTLKRQWEVGRFGIPGPRENFRWFWIFRRWNPSFR